MEGPGPIAVRSRRNRVDRIMSQTATPIDAAGDHDAASNRESQAKELLSRMLSLMGAPLQVESIEEDDRIVLNITGDGAEELIGRKGQILDALQFVLNRMLSRRVADRRAVVVDSGGYRVRRVEALKQMALRLGQEAQRTGKTVAVNPMSAHDRRVIHMALRETPGVVTRSEGEGDERRLLIVPG